MGHTSSAADTSRARLAAGVAGPGVARSAGVRAPETPIPLPAPRTCPCMIAGMSEQTVDELRAKAAEVASGNPPLRVLDNAVLGLLVGIGWLVGRTWWLLVFSVVFAGKGLVTYALAVRHGYRKGGKAMVKAKKPDSATPSNMTPYGPNVQAYSEPG